MTGDPKRIDEVLHRVNCLVEPIEEVSFDSFDIRKMSSWKMVMQEFRTEVQVQLCDNNYIFYNFHFLFIFDINAVLIGIFCLRQLKEKLSISSITPSRRCVPHRQPLTCCWNLNTSAPEMPSTISWWRSLMIFLLSTAKRCLRTLKTFEGYVWFKCCHGDTEIAFLAILMCLLWYCCCLDGPS